MFFLGKVLQKTGLYDIIPPVKGEIRACRKRISAEEKGGTMLKPELKKMLAYNREGLKASARTMQDVYFYTFSHGDKIMCEGHDGLRTYMYSYGQMDNKIRCMAAGLYAKIGAAHQYVALEMDNSVTWVAAFWAILMSGNKPYLVNMRYPKNLTENILRSLNIRYSVCVGQSQLYTEGLDADALEGDFAPVPADIFENEIAFSSSATSMNEVICFYTGKEISAHLLAYEDFFRKGPRLAKHYKGRLKQLAFLPFYHVFGLIAVFFWFTFFGRTLVFLRDYNPDTILKTCRRHQVTHIFAVPMLWHTIEKKVWATAREQNREEKLRKALKFTTKLQNIFPRFGAWCAKRGLKSVTDKLFGYSVMFCISGGSSLRPSAMELVNGLGYWLHNGYGMSEIGIPSVELRKTPKQRNRCSIGMPASCLSYKLDEENVLWVKSPYLCARKMVNGVLTETPEWFCTGDIMTQEKGYYYIQGRKGDLVIGENGENINPDVVESRFTLEGVKQMCVLGMTTDEGQQLCLVAQISPYMTEAAISDIRNQAYATNDTLPATMAVKKFYFTFDELAPPTAIKVSRTQLIRKIEEGNVKLTAFSDLQLTGYEGEDTPLLLQIKSLIAQELQCDAATIGTDSHIFYDLGATSLQYFAIISAISGEFGLTQYENGEIYCYTPKELCAYIERNL